MTRPSTSAAASVRHLARVLSLRPRGPGALHETTIRRSLGSLLCLGAAISLSACGGGSADKKSADGSSGNASSSAREGPDPNDKSDILIGSYNSMTGSEATFGQSTYAGIQLAIEEINAGGGVNGRKLVVRNYDTQGKSQEAGTAVTRLITDDEVTAIIGEVASSLSIAGGRVAQQYGVPMISPSSTNAQVTQIGDMVFRVCFVDSFQGYVAAKFLRENLKFDKVAVLFDQSQAYSKGLKDDFSKAFIALGGTIIGEQAFTGGDPDFSAQLTTIRSLSPQAIYVPGYYTDVGNIALQARKLGIGKNVPLIGGDGWDSSKLAEIGGDAIEGSFYSNHYSPDQPSPEVKQFVEKFTAKFGQMPDGLAALGYDATLILADAMKRAKSLDGKDLAAAIAATQDFAAVTGTISIDANRNASKAAVVVQMKGGKPVFVAAVEPLK